jgi:hypothetical protein
MKDLCSILDHHRWHGFGGRDINPVDEEYLSCSNHKSESLSTRSNLHSMITV